MFPPSLANKLTKILYYLAKLINPLQQSTDRGPIVSPHQEL